MMITKLNKNNINYELSLKYINFLHKGGKYREDNNGAIKTLLIMMKRLGSCKSGFLDYAECKLEIFIVSFLIEKGMSKEEIFDLSVEEMYTYVYLMS